MLKRYLIPLMLCLFLIPATAQDSEEQNKTPGVKTVDLNEVAAGKLKAGLEVGYPFSGLEAGYRFAEKLEANLLVGSVLDFDSIAIGMSLMYTLLNLEVEENIYPISAAPVLYTRFNDEYIEFSVGGLLRGEYDFEFPMNMYLQFGIIYNGETLKFPIALGARYIF